jgi:KDO2-lipid IV(A) lauroyltransferase
LKKYFGYLFFRVFIGFFDIIPFWMIYKMSDGLYLLLYYVIGYRKKVVRDNLRQSFPDWTEAELLKTEKKFYQHLADIFMEGIKAVNLSDKETVKRYKVLTLEAPNKPFSEGRASLFVGSHYNNWEYGALGCGLQVDPLVIVFYKPLKNELINEYIRHSRGQKGTLMAPLNETSAYFKDNFPKHPMYIMISDQSPSNVKECHWVQFFNRETAVLHGPAKYAHKYNLPIYFFKTRKAKRGHYELSGELLIDNPLDYTPEEISAIFTQKIEMLIKEAPEFWLWSHKRWKRKRDND